MGRGSVSDRTPSQWRNWRYESMRRSRHIVMPMDMYEPFCHCNSAHSNAILYDLVLQYPIGEDQHQEIARSARHHRLESCRAIGRQISWIRIAITQPTSAYIARQTRVKMAVGRIAGTANWDLRYADLAKSYDPRRAACDR